MVLVGKEAVELARIRDKKLSRMLSEDDTPSLNPSVIDGHRVPSSLHETWGGIIVSWPEHALEKGSMETQTVRVLSHSKKKDKSTTYAVSAAISRRRIGLVVDDTSRDRALEVNLSKGSRPYQDKMFPPSTAKWRKNGAISS